MVCVATVFIGDGDSEGWGQYPLSGELKKKKKIQPNFGLATPFIRATHFINFLS